MNRYAAMLLAVLSASAAHAAQTDIASVPVMNITGTGTIKPNIMLMLDDSGSMGWDYTPDYVNDSNKCFDSASCSIGKPPYMSPDFNYQYYNPEITYTPGVDSSGTSMGAQSSYSAVKTDPYGVQQRNQSGSSMTTENLLTNYPDLVYCSSAYSSTADLTNTSICKKNAAYSFPEPTGGTFTSAKSVKGAPYYYRIVTTKYCSDNNLVNCIAATSPVGSYIYPAPVRWCTSATSNYAYTACQRNYDNSHTIPEFIGTVKPASTYAAAYGVIDVVTAGSQYSINDMQVDGVSIISTSVSGTTAANFASSLAQAINSSAYHSTPEYSACVGSRNGDNSCSGTPNTRVTIFPQTSACGTGGSSISGCTALVGAAANGRVVAVSGPNIPGTAATGTITVGTGVAGSLSYRIASVDVGTATISTSAINFTGDLSTPAGQQAAAAAIAAKIGAGYSASASNGVVSITANTTGISGNGTLTVVSGATNATASLTVGSITRNATYRLASISAGTTVITSGTITASSSNSNSSRRRRDVASTIAAAITANGFSATSSNDVVTITAPPGASFNGLSLSWTSVSGSTDIPIASTTDFAGGVANLPTSAAGMSGGVNGSMTAGLAITHFANGVDGASVPTRMNVGTFARTDILPCAGGSSDTCYPKASTRSDCAAAAGCTYDEEMLNFSNWYAYYRTRMQTMKSAATLAFNPLSSSYRVGIAKLSQVGYAGGIDMKPADFNAANRATWYGILTNASPGSATPLRTALDNIGKMYANQSPYNYSGTDRVIQYPCQQNFVILTTDGLWNQSYTGNVGNNDNTENAGRFCTRAGGCLDGITSSPTVPSLADVALYWYNGGSNTSSVSLRPDLEPSVALPGVVPASSSDPNTHLHMTTFTLGLGVSGFMNYENNYDTAPILGGDYYKLITGAGGCPWNGGGTYVWPNPSNDTLQAVDDLWHAAVNGHGKYFSARSPAAVVSGLSAAIAAMAVRTGAASAAATSTPNVSQQDNDIFSATFTTVKWYGELFDQKIDPATGNVSSTIAWTSSNTLGQQVSASTDTRIIKMLDTASATPALKDFSYAALSSTEKSWFDNKANTMVQYASLSAADRALASDGSNLLKWMRGQTQYADDVIYRAYTYTTGTSIPVVLGDIDTAKPAYMRDPRKNYGGTYSAFVTAQKTRAATVFAAANDGMLHAFNAADGVERWAYVPRITMPKLWKQAATDYGSNHQFSTDGSPEIADVQINGSWRTVLVAGLNAGGRGYYALDVTNPSTPVALWEFCADSTICSKTDPDLGLTFGNPQFGYWNNKWVVLVASGYNNVPGIDGISSGSGVGYLYVLDVANGTVLKKISTGVGDATTPSGLARITAITSNPQTDPNITYVYGGDNQGNLFRFDFTDSTFTTIPVVKIATLGAAQPITTRPDVAQCQAGSGLQRVVLVGTGRLLGLSDTSTTNLQSVFVIKDSGTALGSLRGSATMVQQTLATLAGTGGSSYTLSSPQAVNLLTKDGWYVDLALNSGERVNLDPKIAFSTAVVATNLPISTSACTVGGTSYNYQFNLCTGSYADPGSNVIGGVLSNTSAAVGFIVIKLPSGTLKMITTTADGGKLTSSVKASASVPSRRSGWRAVKN